MAIRQSAVRLRGVTKRFDDVVAVDDVDLDVGTGEFFAMLGPSGSGKTTMLRLIAGFDLPNSGLIELAGTDVTAHPPFDRDVNTVFQDYALFPHMTVAKNVEYGLKVKRVPRAERRARVDEALASVRLEALGDRKPHQLSGGQRQRVALARALVNRPKVLLLDEPLGALDLKLREEMQVELKLIQQHVGITFVFVTHDQSEALSMSDRVAVFNDGEIQQIDAVQQLYEAPSNRFVAGFVGDSTVWSGTLGAVNGEAAEFVLPTGERLSGINVNGAPSGAAVVASVRPERIDALFAAPADPANVVPATVADVIYFGDHLRVRCSVAGQGQATAKLPLSAGAPPATGQSVWLRVPKPFLRLYA